MRRRLAAISVAAELAGPAAAQGVPTDAEMRDVHAMLLGLPQDGARPERSEGGDIYYAVVDNPAAPRLVTRLELSPLRCRARITSALQFPGKWATLTLGTIDLGRVSAVTAYASVDDMIAEINPVPLSSPGAEQVVLTGRGLYCTSRVSLSGANDAADQACSDRLDLAMTDAQEKASGRRALAIVAAFCNAPAFEKK